MKNKFKFLKLFAITTILGATMLVTKSYANTSIYNALVTDVENVIPFILNREEDFVSIKDIKEESTFKNKTIQFNLENPQESTILCTGDTFKADNTTYTILIYGDVNQDGCVDIFDALTIQENVFEDKLKNIQKVAANVVTLDGSGIDIFDALAIQQYVGGERDTIIDTIPDDKRKPTSNEVHALERAKEYLEIISFSRKGLIEQLEYDGFTEQEATYGVDNCEANWNEQAKKTAKMYVEMMQLPKENLIQQLKYEGFTNEQIEYAILAIGY